jgi:xanthine dehydrogenase accessory factor
MSRHISVISQEWAAAGTPFLRVSVTEAKGSTPREKGARMLVSALDIAGTIGGGRLEHDAIAEARDMLAAGHTGSRREVALGPAIGQCCGGHVTLAFDRLSAADIAAMARDDAALAETRPHAMIYGAGHVGRALARALAPLPLQVVVADGRADEIAQVDAPGVRIIADDALVRLAETAPDGAAHVVMTHSHALDCLIGAAVLERNRFRYLGIIGSRTKKAMFRRAFRETGISENLIRRVVCPIGGSRVRDKRPEVIAALTAAEVATVLLG